MKNLILYFQIFFLLVLISCSHKQERNTRLHNLKMVESIGYIVPMDSLSQPDDSPIEESLLPKLSITKPTIVPSYFNEYRAGNPLVKIAGSPIIITPGSGTFSLPKVTEIVDSSITAGIPEVVVAKDMSIKDQNPHNFSVFNKLQGLKHANIKCLLEDTFGNLWIGTNGGGISKFDGKTFTHFTDKEGLCGNIVWDILEDKYGNIWIGSYGGGVCKYDGKNFTYFSTSNGLSNNNVLSLLEDSKGNIWISTDGGGVCKYDGKTITNFSVENGLHDESVREILEDKFGNLWFTSPENGVLKYDGKKFYHYTVDQGLSSNDVWSIVEDKLGNIWFGTNGFGINKFDGKTFTVYTQNEGLSNNVVISSMMDSKGSLWFGTYGGGVCKFDGDFFTHFTDRDGLSNNDIWTILEDKSQSFWFGTNGGGLCKYSGNKFTHLTVNEGLSNNVIRSIIKDKLGNLWLATDGGGIMKYDGKNFFHYTGKNGLPNNEVLSLLEDSKGNIWFGTNGGGVVKYNGQYFTCFTKKEGLINGHIWSITEDHQGNIWFGSQTGVIKYDGQKFTNFTEKQGLIGGTVKCVFQDKNNNMWFGAMNGLTKYDGKVFTQFNEQLGLSNRDVRAIIEDRNGNLWFGTYGGGVVVYDGKKFIHITDKEGLSNNFVFSILQDKLGNIWLGTRFGLNKLNQKKYNELFESIKTNHFKDGDVFFNNYGYDDGYLGIGCIGNSLCEYNDGEIWIGTNDRLTILHSNSFQSNINIPNVQLTNIELYNENIIWTSLSEKSGEKYNSKDTSVVLGNGVTISDFNFNDISKWYSLPESLELAYNNNFMSFNFIGITLNQSKVVKYQYILEGIDDHWSAISNKTSAPYGNLPPGSYTFKVKAMNSLGNWSQPISYNFIIRPPFWQTWWFRILVGFLIIVSIWLYIKFREKKLIAEKVKLEKIVEARTTELIEKQNEIIDSINYAQRIQKSLLVSENYLNDYLNEYFIFYKPKAIVSGDFYWARKIYQNNLINNFLLLTGDSTGHGVPGAIMSILNISCLEKAIEVEKLNSPSEILNHTRSKIIETLRKDGSKEGGKDGMDCSLILFDFKNSKLTYAAANNPIWIVRSKELIELKPDKMPVGKHDKDSIPFTQFEIELKKDDVVYTFTDGLPDQFGGPKGKKFMYKQLKDLLISISHDSMSKQKELIEEAFNSWKGNLEQVDDITLIGIRI